MFSAVRSVELDQRAILGRSRREDSEGVRPRGESGEFSTPAGSHVIRHRMPMPELDADGPALFVLTFTTNIPRGRITHLSIVNGDVTDGAIWEVPPGDATGTFTVSAIVRPPLREIVVYANLQGEIDGVFRLDALTARSLACLRPLRLAFVVDPWVERSDPEWKADYLWWFGQMDNALRRAGVAIESHSVSGDHVAPLWPQHRPNPEASHSAIPARDLLRIYGSHREGLVDQRKRLVPGGDDRRKTALVGLLRSAMPWEPDVVIANSDMGILRDAFPRSLVLFRDALYCREPFPDELTSLDPFGLYHRSALARIVPGVPLAEEYAVALEAFYPVEEEVRELLGRHGLGQGEFVLLPLQDSRHVNFFDESPFGDQVDMVLACLDRFPDRRILLTQHPDRPEIAPAALAALLERHPNLRYVAELETFSNPSARVLPLAESVAGVSTGLLIQALLLGKPVHHLGRHALEPLGLASCSAEERRRIAGALLLRHFAPYRYLHDGRWLWTRLAVLDLWGRGAVGPEALAIDLPGNVVRTLRDHARPVPGVERAPTLPPDAPAGAWNAEEARVRVGESLRLRADLLELVRPGGVGIELGVAEGHFAEELLAKGRLSHLWGVDMYAGDRGHDDRQYLRALHRVAAHRGRHTLMRMRFDRAIDLFPDGFFDFLYFDGYAHDSALGEKLFSAWYPKAKPGGVLAGHDYAEAFPLVVAAADRFAARHSLRLHVVEDRSGGWNFQAPSWYVIKRA